MRLAGPAPLIHVLATHLGENQRADRTTQPQAVAHEVAPARSGRSAVDDKRRRTERPAVAAGHAFGPPLYQEGRP